MNLFVAMITGLLAAIFVFTVLASIFVSGFLARCLRPTMRPLMLSGVVIWALMMTAAITQINLATQVFGLLPAANGGLAANASAFTGILRDASGTASASELSGDCTTSGSNVITCQKDNGTTIPVNSAADQALITTASATGGWATLPNGVVQYSTATHTFSLATVITGTFSDNETPSGTINGANTTFTLAHTPSPAASLTCFENGVAQRAAGADFTLATATMTYGVAPPTNTTLVCSYRW